MAKRTVKKSASASRKKPLVSPLQKHKCGDCNKRFSVMMKRNRKTGEMEYYCSLCWKANFESGPKYEQRMKEFAEEQKRIREARQTKKRVIKKKPARKVKKKVS